MGNYEVRRNTMEIVRGCANCKYWQLDEDDEEYYNRCKKCFIWDDDYYNLFVPTDVIAELQEVIASFEGKLRKALDAIEEHRNNVGDNTHPADEKLWNITEELR